MANPTKITFRLPDTYKDDTPFQTADIDHVQAQFDGGVVADVTVTPSAGGDGRKFEFPIPAGLTFGTHSVKAAVVADNGAVSEFASGSFVLADERVPNPPTSLQAE